MCTVHQNTPETHDIIELIQIKLEMTLFAYNLSLKGKKQQTQKKIVDDYMIKYTQ